MDSQYCYLKPHHKRNHFKYIHHHSSLILISRIKNLILVHQIPQIMQCSKCGNELRCQLSFKTEETDRPIEISYQWWYCENCSAKYYGILEDSNVNMFDDRLLHKGFLVAEDKWQESLAETIKCPNPGDASCKFALHNEGPPAGFYGEQAWYTYD